MESILRMIQQFKPEATENYFFRLIAHKRRSTALTETRMYRII